MTTAQKRRRAVVLLAALLLLWWFWTGSRPPATAPLEQVVQRTPHRAGVPAWTLPPAEEAPPPDAALPETPTEEANRRIAEAIGLMWVVCPQPRTVDIPHGWMGRLPSGWEADRFYFSTASPAGKELVRAGFGGPVVAVMRWWVNPDGTSTCVEEAPRKGSAEIEVVAPDGLPIEGVLAHNDSMVDSAMTDTDGVATVEVYNGQEVEVEVSLGLTYLDSVWVADGDRVTVTVDVSKGTPFEEQWLDTRSERYQTALDLLDATRILLDAPDLSEPVRGLLTAKERDYAMSVESPPPE